MLLPAGALGMSILLGSADAKAEREILTGSPSATGSTVPVAERLEAIRNAVSDVFGEQRQLGTDGTERLAWHNCANFGGWPWGDWKNKWKDWNNNWHNGWNNWGNNWKNWGNGWNNW